MCLKTQDLQIREVIQKCQEAGFVVVWTISNQGRINVSAINYLCQNYGTRNNGPKSLKISKVREEEVVNIFDPLHLMKEMRNNLLNKNLIWTTETGVYTAKWENIILYVYFFQFLYVYFFFVLFLFCFFFFFFFF